MENEKKERELETEEKAAENPEAASAEAATAETAAEKPAEKKKKKKEPSADAKALEKLQAEFEEHRQQYLRVLAEYDNFRKRTQAEKTAIYNNAISDAVQAILPIADNIDRALSQENASAEDMYKGIEMIQSQIGATFEKLGITEIGKVGEVFDPNLHNAVAHTDDESFEENTISQVFQKGYALGDRVVRYAMVQVAN